MAQWTQAAPPNAHVTYMAELDRWNRLFLHYRCGVCGDVSTKLCNDAQKAPYWLRYYVGFHPPHPHAKS